MSIRRLLVFLGVVSLLMMGPAPAQEEGAPASKDRPNSALRAGLEDMSHLQSMLEFFFMEAGVYPPSLNELDLGFNDRLPSNAKRLVIPTDPASGKAFVYTPSENLKSYTLGFPDPSLYGLGQDFELRPVSWGWLALLAERKRFENLAQQSKRDMQLVATAVEMYAKDNSGGYPEKLDPLFPDYIKRHPQDPISGKNYVYKKIADGYLVSSPNPERYGLKLFEYSSSRGMVVEPLPADAKP